MYRLKAFYCNYVLTCWICKSKMEDSAPCLLYSRKTEPDENCQVSHKSAYLHFICFDKVQVHHGVPVNVQICEIIGYHQLSSKDKQKLKEFLSINEDDNESDEFKAQVDYINQVKKQKVPALIMQALLEYNEQKLVLNGTINFLEDQFIDMMLFGKTLNVCSSCESALFAGDYGYMCSLSLMGNGTCDDRIVQAEKDKNLILKSVWADYIKHLDVNRFTGRLFPQKINVDRG